jgi:hypothetical protein
MLKLAWKVLGMFLVLLCAAPCVVVGGETPGLPPGDGRPKQTGWGSSSLIAATGIWYAQGALETRNQNHKAIRLFVAGLLFTLFLGSQRLILHVIKSSCCRICNFLHCLAASLLLSAQAPSPSQYPMYKPFF